MRQEAHWYVVPLIIGLGLSPAAVAELAAPVSRNVASAIAVELS